MAETGPGAPDTFRTEAEAVLFGFDPTPAAATLRARARAWRVGGAARSVGIALLVAPAVAVVPPHAPWVIGALATGGILARRRWTELFTLVSIEGTCPKCGAGLAVKPGRLRSPHPLPCEGCHHESTLRIPAGVLDAHEAE